MSPELEKQLLESYPMLYSQRYKGMKETCMCWGFETGDGWYEIIDGLSSELEAMNEEIVAGKEGDSRWMVASSLSAFFCLGFVLTYLVNFSITGEGHNTLLVGCVGIAGLLAVLTILRIRRTRYDLIEATQVKEKFGTLRFYVGPVDEAYYDEVMDLVDQAEKESAKTCETCGKSGAPNSEGWITTLCDDCRKARFNDRKDACASSGQPQDPNTCS